MEVLARGRKRRREPLTHEKILRAALAYVDEHGLEALTIRNLAASLDVAPMTIYGHVENKDEILTGIGEIVLDDIPVPPAEGSWRGRMAAVARSYRELLIEHRNALPVSMAQDSLDVLAARAADAYIAGRTLESDRDKNDRTGTLRGFDAALGILCELGLDVAEAFLATNAIIFFTRGLVISETRFLKFAEDADEFFDRATALQQLLQSLPESAAPRLVALAPKLAQLTPWRHFEYGLERLLDGIEAHINETVGGSEPKT